MRKAFFNKESNYRRITLCNFLLGHMVVGVPVVCGLG